jgi:hypothetical protein
VVDVWDGLLGEEAGVVHHEDRLARVATLGSLARQHDTVGAIENGVTDIADFGAGRARVVGHGLEHLGGTDDWLAGDVALGDHHLLGHEYLSRRNLDTEIATGDHDTVGDLEDGVEVADTLLVLDLGDDLDVLALLAEHFADGQNVVGATDERSKDHVDIVLDTKSQVGLVLFRKSWEVDVGLWQVDALSGRDLAVVDSLGTNGLLVLDLDDLEGKDTVVDVDGTALLDDLGDVLVVDVPTIGQYRSASRSVYPRLHVLVVGSSGILLVGGDVDLVTGRDWDIGIIRGVSGTDLWALGVQSYCKRTTWVLLLGLLGVVNDRLVVLFRRCQSLQTSSLVSPEPSTSYEP